MDLAALCMVTTAAEARAWVDAQGGDAAVAAWRDSRRCTVLHIAFRWIKIAMPAVHALLDTGVDVNAVTAYGLTALQLAREPEQVHALLAAGAHTGVVHRARGTALLEFVERSYGSCADVVGALLPHCSPRTVLYKFRGETALDIVSHYSLVFVSATQTLALLRDATKDARSYLHKEPAMRVGLAAADAVRVRARKAGKTWQL